jgi:hypothetical protein
MPPTAPDVRSLDESESNNHPTLLSTMASLRTRNELEKEGRRRRPRQRKEARDTYEAELAEYNKRKSEREVEERPAVRAHRASYDKIREALEELKVILHPNEEQVQP